MPADSSIYGMIRPYQAPADPLHQYGVMMQLRAMGDQADLSALQRQQLQESMAEHTGLKKLFAMGVDPSTQQVAAVSPQFAQTYAKAKLDNEKTRGDIDKTKIETHGAQVKQLRDQLAGVSDDAGLAALRESASKLYGPNVVASMPATVAAPGFAEWKQSQLMTADKLVEQLNANRTAAETARHHQATEGQSTATLAETRRYHDAMIGTPPNSNDPDYQAQINYWAEVVKKGGALPPGLARGPGGGAFVREVTKRAAVGDVAPEEMMANQARFTGEKAGQRTLGTRTANIEMAATEAASLADLAKQASAKVDRTQFKTLNDVIQAGQRATSSPELRAFVASNTSLINAYARAINPQGVGTVADKEHARDMLSTAFSKGDYEAAINQLMKEIDAARKSPGTVQKEMRDRFTGKEQPLGGAEPGKAASGGIKFLGWEK